jgi:parallel beta-helix repeat protein
LKGIPSSLMVASLFLSLLAFTFIIQPVGSKASSVIALASPQTIIVPDNYTTIQAAINNAIVGDTILVKPGTYYGSVVVNKNVSLVGENRNTTIIDGSGNGPVVTLSANGISVTNLTVRNGGHVWSPQDTCVWGNGLSSILIEDVTVKNASNGIIFHSLSHSSMLHDFAEECGTMGLHFDSSSDCEMINNTVINSFQGIVLERSTGNVIQGNNLVNNNVSMDFYASAGNSIERNNLAKSNVSIVLFSSNGINVFKDNNMTDDTCNLIVWGSSIEDFIQNIDTSNTANNKKIYYITNSHDLLIDPSNCPDNGYLALVNCTHMTIEDIDLSNDNDGMLMAQSTNCSLVDITLANAHTNIILRAFSPQPIIHGGLTFFKSDDNLITDSRITNNSVGICLYQSSGNLFYHNAFDEIDKPVISNFQSPGLPPSGSYSINKWDNGYPSGGNYWSNYTGVDQKNGLHQNQTGSDGMGDTPYAIDANNTDHYPLMGIFNIYPVQVPLHAPHFNNVTVISNSTITGFLAPISPENQEIAFISFNVIGKQGSTGFCRVSIPTAVMNGTYHVFVNSTEILYTLLPCSNADISYLYFTYKHPTEQVTILSESPPLIILPLFTIATFFGVMFFKRKRNVNK